MRKKTEILYGIHSVSEALKTRRRNFFELYIAKDKISYNIFNKQVEEPLKNKSFLQFQMVQRIA